MRKFSIALFVAGVFAVAHAQQQVVVTGNLTGPSLPQMNAGSLIFGASDEFAHLNPGGNITPREWHEYNRWRNMLRPGSENNSDVSCPEDASGAPNTNPITDNPVIIATGEKVLSQVDFEVLGENGFSYTRTYRSGHSDPWFTPASYPQIRAFYQGCVMGSDGYCYPRQVTLIEQDGSSYTYYQDLLSTYSLAGAAYTGSLTFYAPQGKWELKRDKHVYVFDSKTSPNTGVLTSVARGGVVIQTRSYNADNSMTIDLIGGRQIRINRNSATGRLDNIIAPGGAVYTYGYDTAGRLSTVTSPGPNPTTRVYHYEGADARKLTGVTVNGVRQYTYSYYPDGRVQTSGTSDGESRDSFQYTSTQTTITTAQGQPTVYTFQAVTNTLKKLTSTSRLATPSCSAAFSQIVYDANGWIDYTIDWNGYKTDYTYDPKGQLKDVTIAAGTADAQIKQNVWDAEGDLREIIHKTAGGVAFYKVAYTYAPFGSIAYGRITSITESDLRLGGQRSTTFEYAYHANQAIATITERRSIPGGPAITISRYDASGNLVSRTNAVGHTETWAEHTPTGRPGYSTDANNVRTNYVWHPNGDLTTSSTNLPNGTRSIQYAYDGDHRITDITYADGRADRKRYTAGGRLASAGDALHQFISFVYDVPNNTVTASSPRRVAAFNGSSITSSAAGTFSTVRQLDSLGRPWIEYGNNGQRVTYTYDNNGNLRSRTDAGNRSTGFAYDGQNRLRSVSNPDGGSIIYHYNAEGRLEYVQDPRGVRTNYTYNGFGQVLSESSPDSGSKTYEYDSAGRVYSVTWSNGKRYFYAWDALDRVASRTSGTNVERFFYDEGAFGKGRLTRITDSSGQSTYSYTAAGEPLQQLNTIQGQSYTTQWNWDAQGRLLSLTYPTGLVISYGYDAQGRLAAIDKRSIVAGRQLSIPAWNKRALRLEIWA